MVSVLKPLRPLHGSSSRSCKICSHWRSYVTILAHFVCSAWHKSKAELFLTGKCAELCVTGPKFVGVRLFSTETGMVTFYFKYSALWADCCASKQQGLCQRAAVCSSQRMFICKTLSNSYKVSQMAERSWMERAETLWTGEFIGVALLSINKGPVLIDHYAHRVYIVYIWIMAESWRHMDIRVESPSRKNLVLLGVQHQEGFPSSSAPCVSWFMKGVCENKHQAATWPGAVCSALDAALQILYSRFFLFQQCVFLFSYLQKLISVCRWALSDSRTGGLQPREGPTGQRSTQTSRLFDWNPNKIPFCGPCTRP